ncbi:unnamed protein product [Pedinophyceae sp. YPF-701]|nr:unnamed protein product [Pedinophyceae sp. YPF-701]
MSEKGKGFSEAQVLGLEGPPKMSKNWSWQRKKRLSRALETFDKFQPGKIRQVGCFLAGANNYSHTGATANAQYFAYCSTLAVYAFSCRTRTLAAVLSQFEDNLSACVLSTVEPEVVATCTCTGLLQVWNVISCDLLAETRYDKADPPRLLVFDKVHPKVLHIATTRTVSKVGWQDKPEGAAETMPLNVLAGPFKVGSTHEVRTLSISTRNPALAIVGCTDAIFYVYEHQATKGRGDRPLGLGKPKKLGEITSEFADVQFDLLSPTYAVLCLKDGRMYLHDLEQGINMVSFSKQAVGNWRVCFLPKMPGTFVTVSERAGALHVWNVSQGQPLRSLRTGLPGISSVCLLEDSSVVVLTATDGSVICYDVETRRVAWDANAGHTDTIFHCALSNKDPDVLATCSFDRMVRIWNLRDMECTQVLPGAADVLYSVSWSPDDALIAAACFNGSVVLYDVKKGVAKRSLKVHQARCMKVAWHPTNQDLLCSAGNDRRCVVFRMDGSGVAEFTHAAAVIGCCWSPHGKDIIATIDHSGMVRVLDVGQVALVVKFPSMHQSTGFSVAWSPLVPDLILSTSSDGTARVWDVAKKVSVQCLEGHQDRVRAATWHPEVPYLAFTGSWDADIRVWDVRSGACLAAWSQHQADVYGISIHPKRPFVLCTCSRDTTTTVLSIDDMFTPIKVGALMGRSQQGVTDDVMKKGAPPQLCGPVGAHVGESPQLSPLELLERVADAMLPQNGSQALVELVRASVSPGNSGGSVVHSARVPHMSRVAEILNAQAQEVELLRSTTKMRGIGAASRRLEVLNKAARAHLLAGNIGQCADIMAELGRWEEALVMASLDSPEKWRSMVARRGQDLLDNGGTVDDVAPMFLASGDTSRLVSMLIAAERYSEAYSIAAMRQLGGYSVAPQVNPVTNRHSRTRSQPDMGAIDGLAQKLAKEKIGGDGEASPAREASAAEGSAASTSTRSPLPPSGRAVLPPLQRVGTAGRGGDLPPSAGSRRRRGARRRPPTRSKPPRRPRSRSRRCRGRRPRCPAARPARSPAARPRSSSRSKRCRPSASSCGSSLSGRRVA